MKYKKVYQDLLENIRNNEYDLKIPSTRMLMQEYKVSQSTIEKVISLLLKDGLIYVKKMMDTT